ncbi:MAG: FixH family protein [Proteobacteria bacterium]|nr:FixH family protein [Pseudomonadota bacterium]
MKPGWQWPWIIVGLLGANALAVLLLIVLATHDPSHAVERDYYAKGLAWDAEQAAARAGERLGWKLALAIAPARQWGKRRIEARLVDRDGRALAGARLQLEARHLARAAEVLRTALTPLGAGRYAATLPLRRPGLWELRLVVEQGGRRWTRSLTRELEPLTGLAVPAAAGAARREGELE